MWFIFLIACIVVALAALLVILIGSVVVRYIVRKDREMERKFFEMDKENKRAYWRYWWLFWQFSEEL